MSDNTPLSHLDKHGKVRMVDVGQKPETERVATARAEVHMSPETLAIIRAGELKKGDVFTVAKLAGVQAAHALLVVVAGRTGRRPGTLMTASGHLVAALGLFFLFVSFAL